MTEVVYSEDKEERLTYGIKSNKSICLVLLKIHALRKWKNKNIINNNV